jgi:hypothetical protein
VIFLSCHGRFDIKSYNWNARGIVGEMRIEERKNVAELEALATALPHARGEIQKLRDARRTKLFDLLSTSPLPSRAHAGSMAGPLPSGDRRGRSFDNGYRARDLAAQQSLGAATSAVMKCEIGRPLPVGGITERLTW